MKPMVRPFVRAALASLEHAHTHLTGSGPVDLAQVVISLDHMAELLLKAALLERGESIFDERTRKTVGLPAALKTVGSTHAAEIEVIHEQRNQVQHFFAYGQPAEAAELFDTGWRFAQELLAQELGTRLEDETRVRPPLVVQMPHAGVQVDPSTQMQRDTTAQGPILAWADGREGNLRVRMRVAGGQPEWLTPAGDFEYMPVTNGTVIAVYRQSGGIVVYDVDSRRRRILTETGGPGDVNDGLVAAQGLAIEGGLGGGIALVSLEGSPPDVVSETGSSPKLWAERVFWQELRGEVLEILARDIRGGPTHTVVPGGGTHPSVHDHLITWTDRARRPSVHVMDLRSGERRTISDAGIFPNTRYGRTAFLEHTGPDDQAPALSYALVVYDWHQDEIVLRIADVGFPTGRGAILTDESVYWEMMNERGVIQVWEHSLP